jgi:5,5'-dehydrodivanillate O-demethylase
MKMTPDENERLTRVGPGTPAGEMLRRYWWPVWFSEDLHDKPVPVRLLGEDLVLFRQGDGQAGLLDRHCPHRGASLELGRVEEDGLRCCYHGWKFAADGHCLDMPAEPAGSPLINEVRQDAYAVQEVAGLVFACIGPDPVPEFPRYDLLFAEGVERNLGATLDHCNWLQRAENGVDQLHAGILHAAGYPELALKRAEIEWTREWYGVRAAYSVAGGQGKVSHCLLPANNRYFGARVDDRPSQNMHFRVPVDDEKTLTFSIRAYESEDGADRVISSGLRVKERGVYELVEDGWFGIASRDQDRAAQESQGIIADRTREILGTSDRGVVLFRRMVMDAIDAVERGEDPPGVVREKQSELIIFDASQTRDGQLMEA